MIAAYKTFPLIGGHVSAAGGAWNALDNADRIGADCIQIFGSSPRQFAVRMPADADVKKYRDRIAHSRVRAVFLHAPYLVNIASPSAQLRALSVTVLAGHLAIAERLEAHGLIFHVGSGKEMPKEDAFTAAVTAMKEVLKRAKGHAQLIIENSAGGGQKLSSLPEEIGEMMAAVGSSRVKVCIDTAHAFEAGLIEEYSAATVKKHFDRWDKAVGLREIVALHANDSKTSFNSHHDRHENIGEGYIGLRGFRALAAERRLWDKAWLLEVPGFANEGPDKKNVDILRACFAKAR